MPHVIVKLHPGRSEDQKMRLTEAITKNVMEIAQCEEKTVSVAFEEVEPADWPGKSLPAGHPGKRGPAL